MPDDTGLLDPAAAIDPVEEEDPRIRKLAKAMFDEMVAGIPQGFKQGIVKAATTELECKIRIDGFEVDTDAQNMSMMPIAEGDRVMVVFWNGACTVLAVQGNRAGIPVGGLLFQTTAQDLGDSYLLLPYTDPIHGVRTLGREEYPILNQYCAADGYPWGAGNGSTTFNLPDVENRWLVAVGSGYALGAKGGSTGKKLVGADVPQVAIQIPIYSGSDGQQGFAFVGSQAQNTLDWRPPYAAVRVYIRAK